MTRPRAIIVIMAALACTRTPSTPETRPPAEVAPAPPEPAEPLDPLARMLAATPSTTAFAELLGWFEAQPPGPARDRALARATHALATWPDRTREAPDTWVFDLVARRMPVAWPLVRRVKASFIDPENALKLLRAPGLAIITDLDLRADGSKDEMAAVALALQTSPHIANVTSLGLQLAGGPALARMVTQPRPRPLRHLRLTTDLGADGAAILATAPALAQLEGLDLSFIALSRSDLEVLTNSPHLRRLRSLALAGADLDDADLAVLAGGFPALRELDLGRNRFGLAGLDTLTSAAFFAGLDRLDLAEVGLGDAGAQRLAPRLGAGLRELRLAGNPLGPDGIAAIAEARQLDQLEVLDLSSPVQTQNVGRKGALALAAATHLGRLREVAFNAWDDGRMGRDVFLALAAAPWLVCRAPTGPSAL